MAGSYEDVTTLAPSQADLAENVVTVLSEKAYDECGEGAEEWPELPEGAEEELGLELGKVVEAWMKKHLKMPAWTAAWADPKVFKGVKQ